MMRIKSLASAPDRAGRYRVVFEDDSVLRLYRQTVQDFGLYAGQELSDAEFSKLQESEGEMSAKMRAVRIVAASSVSKRDLEHRLVQKGENPEQAKVAVAWMSDMSLLDDQKTHATTKQMIDTMKNMTVVDINGMFYHAAYTDSKTLQALEKIFPLTLNCKDYLPKDLKKTIKKLRK